MNRQDYLYYILYFSDKPPIPTPIPIPIQKWKNVYNNWIINQRRIVQKWKWANYYWLERRKEERQKKYRKSECYKEKNRIWRKNNYLKIRRSVYKNLAKRRGLGYFLLNEEFKGSEGHHINKTNILYIPKELHRSVSHNIWTGRGMDKINDLAFKWLNKDGEKR